MTEIGRSAVNDVSRLHDAIAARVTGRLPQDSFDEDITGYLAPGFRLVEPDGTIAHRDEILKGLDSYRGKNPDFRIEIANCEVVEERADLVVVTYLERQTGATRAKATNTRRSTCVLKVGDRATLVFLHETWVND